MSHQELNPIPLRVEGANIALITARFNAHITEPLFQGAKQSLIENGIDSENIYEHNVPGAFELPLGTQWLLRESDADAVIALGCVIRGDTPHFDYVCLGCMNGLTNLALQYNKPVILGVLTCDTEKQALERIGGKHGHKGKEAAYAALEMVTLNRVIN